MRRYRSAYDVFWVAGHRVACRSGDSEESRVIHAGTRWFAVGSAEGAEPARSVGAVNQALIYDAAKLLVVSISQPYDPPALLAHIRARSAGVPVIGLTRTFQLYGDQVLSVS
jgi:hypothetical protein